MPRPKTFSENRITKAIRIPEELDTAIKKLADERQVSVNLIATWALQAYVDSAEPVERIAKHR